MSEKRESTNSTTGGFYSITPSGYFGSSPKNIVTLENFMTKEEQQILYEFAKNNKN
jgi:hypothetical protein